MAAGGQRPVTRMKKSWGEEKPHCRWLTGRQGPHASSRPLTAAGGRLPAAPGLEASLCAPRPRQPPPPFLPLTSLCLSVSVCLPVSSLCLCVSQSLCLSPPSVLLPQRTFSFSFHLLWLVFLRLFCPVLAAPFPGTHPRPQAPASPLHRSSSSVCPGPPATPPSVPGPHLHNASQAGNCPCGWSCPQH